MGPPEEHPRGQRGPLRAQQERRRPCGGARGSRHLPDPHAAGGAEPGLGPAQVGGREAGRHGHQAAGGGACRGGQQVGHRAAGTEVRRENPSLGEAEEAEPEPGPGPPGAEQVPAPAGQTGPPEALQEQVPQAQDGGPRLPGAGRRRLPGREGVGLRADGPRPAGGRLHPPAEEAA